MYKSQINLQGKVQIYMKETYEALEEIQYNLLQASCSQMYVQLVSWDQCPMLLLRYLESYSIVYLADFCEYVFL